MSSTGQRVFCRLAGDHNGISGEWALEDYIFDRTSANRQMMNGVLDQTFQFSASLTQMSSITVFQH